MEEHFREQKQNVQKPHLRGCKFRILVSLNVFSARKNVIICSPYVALSKVSRGFTLKRPSHGKLKLANSCWQTRVGKLVLANPSWCV